MFDRNFQNVRKCLVSKVAIAIQPFHCCFPRNSIENSFFFSIKMINISLCETHFQKVSAEICATLQHMQQKGLYNKQELILNKTCS